MKKTKKGTYGYIRHERKRRLLITLASFAIPLIIYVTGYIQTKTRLNLFTFVAILGCIPAAQAMVSFIMIAMQKPFAQKDYETSAAAAGNLTAAYEMIFTAYEHTTNVGALVVCGDHVVCYTADDKIESAKLEKHIGKLLTANGFGDVQVKVMKDMKNYVNRVKDICAKQDHLREGLTFTPDSRYPDLTRDEMVLHVLLAICL